MEETAKIRERIGALDAKLTAAHSRIDKMEIILKDDLTEIKKELKLVVAWMNRSLGWAAALLFVGGIIGSLIGLLLRH